MCEEKEEEEVEKEEEEEEEEEEKEEEEKKKKPFAPATVLYTYRVVRKSLTIPISSYKLCTNETFISELFYFSSSTPRWCFQIGGSLTSFYSSMEEE